MDCLRIKKLLNFGCCTSSDNENEVKVTRISKIGTNDNIITLYGGNITDDNHKKGEKNQAFEAEDNEVFDNSKSQLPKVKCELQVPQKQEAPFRNRQISEISDFLPRDEKGLTELVMEEIEKSFSYEENTENEDHFQPCEDKTNLNTVETKDIKET